jgi:hypothetical protein
MTYGLSKIDIKSLSRFVNKLVAQRFYVLTFHFFLNGNKDKRIEI